MRDKALAGGGDSMMPRFSVIVLTYNRRDLLGKTLESLAGQDYPMDRFEVVVVNDGSTDGTREFLGEFAKAHREVTMRVIDSDRNRGTGPSRNLGVKASGGDIIAYIDDDCTAGKNWLRTLDAVYALRPDVRSAVVRLLNGREDNVYARYFHSHHVFGMNTLHIPADEGLREMVNLFKLPDVDCFLGGCEVAHGSFRRTAFDEAGLYDEGMVMAEDAEFRMRLNERLGDRLFFACGASVTHYYETGFLTLMRHFFTYGRGGHYFRGVRSHKVRDYSFWRMRWYTAKYIAAISIHLKRNWLEFPLFLVLSASSQLCQLLGEAYSAVAGGRSERRIPAEAVV
jgi:glycosyltransferase involved in cell wall biosynthesis